MDDSIRDRVVFLGGKAAGVDCPDCELKTIDIDLDASESTDVTCPECGTTILSEDEKAQLRQAGKL